MKDYAQKLSVLRRMQGIPQKTIAAEIGVKQETVSKWETGIQPIPDGRIDALAMSLTCSPPDFRAMPLPDLVSKMARG